MIALYCNGSQISGILKGKPWRGTEKKSLNIHMDQASDIVSTFAILIYAQKLVKQICGDKMVIMHSTM